MEGHFRDIGIKRVADLKGKNPEELFEKDCLQKGFRDDRCVLYIFRLAVYYAEHETHEEEKLKWWYWKEREYRPLKQTGDERKDTAFPCSSC